MYSSEGSTVALCVVRVTGQLSESALNACATIVNTTMGSVLNESVYTAQVMLYAFCEFILSCLIVNSGFAVLTRPVVSRISFNSVMALQFLGSTHCVRSESRNFVLEF